MLFYQVYLYNYPIEHPLVHHLEDVSKHLVRDPLELLKYILFLLRYLVFYQKLFSIDLDTKEIGKQLV